jgi:hypothetical protein
MGRWAGHQYRLREGKTLTVITVYRPCQQSPSEACTTSNYQQRLLYQKETGKKVDPRKLFMADLTSVIKKIENDPNNMVVLMWDANESINDQSGAIRKLITETTLVDAFAQVAGYPGELTTYTRGKKRLDYILTSQALVPYITRVGYLAFYESNHSDHCGLFIDITESILDTKVTLHRPTKRRIGSKSKPSMIFNYKQFIHKQFLTHRIYERAAEILQTSAAGPATKEIIKKINNLDKQITEIMLAAEQSQCQGQYDSKWSIVIHQQSLLCKYWAVIVKGARNNIDTTSRSTLIYDQLPEFMRNEVLQATHGLDTSMTKIKC